MSFAGLDSGAKVPATMRSTFFSRVFSGVLLTGLTAGPRAAAQPPSFEAVKKAHAAEIDRTVQPLRERYCRALLELEQTLAAKGDYDGARTVRKERRGIEELTKATAGKSAALPSPEPDGSVSLHAEAAEPSGGAKLDVSGKHLTGWSMAGAAARWLLPAGLGEGGYEVEISFSLSPASGKGAGIFQIKENFHTLIRPLNPADVQAPEPSPAVSAAAASNEIITMTFGTLRLRSNATALEMKTVTPEPGVSLQLRSVRLIPMAPSDS